MHILVSVIITTYKREPDLVIRAIKSVCVQTYSNLEIIIVDDSPADYPYRKDVEEQIKKCKNEYSIDIRYIAHERNRGACAARNTGLEAARGEYVAFLDDDDEWIPEKIDKQMNVMMEEDVALVYCGCICKNDTTGEMIKRKMEYHKGYIFDLLIYNNFIKSTSFPLIKKTCLQSIGGFDVEMQSAQDYDVWLRLSEKYQISYVAEPLVIYHIHDGERITANPIKRINGLERLNDKYKKYIEAHPEVWYERNIKLTTMYACVGEKTKALHIWAKCFYMCPQKIIESIKYLYYIIRSKTEEKI